MISSQATEDFSSVTIRVSVRIFLSVFTIRGSGTGTVTIHIIRGIGIRTTPHTSVTIFIIRGPEFIIRTGDLMFITVGVKQNTEQIISQV